MAISRSPPEARRRLQNATIPTPPTVPMKVDRVIPFGRSFEEYRLMFSLEEGNKTQRVLGVGDGPASFNAEATRAGWKVTSVDPLYQTRGRTIRKDFESVVDSVIARTQLDPSRWVWNYCKDPEDLRRHRRETIGLFLADFEEGLNSGRYVAGALPDLPFPNSSFEVALCSHLLFLYSDILDLPFHIEAITEILRVAPEVRVFPILTMDGDESNWVDPVIAHFRTKGIQVRIEPVAYEFQRGGGRQVIFSQQAAS